MDATQAIGLVQMVLSALIVVLMWAFRAGRFLQRRDDDEEHQNNSAKGLRRSIDRVQGELRESKDRHEREQRLHTEKIEQALRGKADEAELIRVMGLYAEHQKAIAQHEVLLARIDEQLKEVGRRVVDLEREQGPTTKRR